MKLNGFNGKRCYSAMMQDICLVSNNSAADINSLISDRCDAKIHSKLFYTFDKLIQDSL